MEYVSQNLAAIVGLIGALGTLSSGIVEIIKPRFRRWFNQRMFESWPSVVRCTLIKHANQSNHLDLPPKTLLKLKDDVCELFLTNPESFKKGLIDLLNPQEGTSLHDDVLRVTTHMPEQEVTRQQIDAAQRIRKHLKVRSNIETPLVLESWQTKLLICAGVVNTFLVLICSMTGYIPWSGVPVFLILGTVLAPVSRDLYKTIQQLRKLS